MTTTDVGQPQQTDLSGTWVLDPAHTRLGFSARHAMVATVRGSFGSFRGTVEVDGTDPSRSSATVEVDTASISTGNDQRDGHLRSPDFLDVENHPLMTFQSTRIEGSGNDFTLTGDLTIRGVTRPVTLELEFQGTSTDPFGNLRAGFEGRGTITRKDWGLEWNAALETGGVLVSDKVKLDIDVSAIKQA